VDQLVRVEGRMQKHCSVEVGVNMLKFCSGVQGLQRGSVGFDGRILVNALSSRVLTLTLQICLFLPLYNQSWSAFRKGLIELMLRLTPQF